MSTYAETVRNELERLEDLELQQRLNVDGLTEEARAIAISILNTRGAPLEPPASASLANGPSDPANQPLAKPPARSAFLGLGVLATAAGFSVLFNSSASVGYGIGIAVGHLLASSVIALPFFLVWRFFSRSGRTKSLATGFNIFTAFVVVAWLLFFVVLALLLPNILSSG